MKTKDFLFKTYEQAQEFLTALDEIKFTVDYVTSHEEDAYVVYVTFNENANDIDMYIVDNIALKILTKI